jgi:membrane protein
MLLDSFTAFYRFILKIVNAFGEDKAFKHGAAISYYTIFSLPAILIILIYFTGTFLGEAEVKEELLDQIEAFVGSDSRQQVANILERANTEKNSWWTTLLGIGSLLFGATGVFYTLKDSLNAVWKLDAPQHSGGIIKLLFDRVLSFAMVLTLGFILTVSMMLKTLLFKASDLLKEFSETLISFLQQVLPGENAWVYDLDLYLNLAYVLEFAVSLGVITALFALIFRFLPDARVRWNDIWIGAILTSLLFALGELLISWYLGQSNINSTYGAAGSLVLILVWVFYSAQILLLGAEFIYAYTETKGRPIKVSRLADSIINFSLWEGIQRLLGREPKDEEAEARIEALEEQNLESEEELMP